METVKVSLRRSVGFHFVKLSQMNTTIVIQTSTDDLLTFPYSRLESCNSVPVKFKTYASCRARRRYGVLLYLIVYSKFPTAF